MLRKDYKSYKNYCCKGKTILHRILLNIVDERLKRYRVNHKQCREKPYQQTDQCIVGPSIEYLRGKKAYVTLATNGSSIR